jgi:HD-GYP domain-containing protein (c-di-GMP phosphodiesterase class II)
VRLSDIVRSGERPTAPRPVEPPPRTATTLVRRAAKPDAPGREPAPPLREAAPPPRESLPPLREPGPAWEAAKPRGVPAPRPAETPAPPGDASDVVLHRAVERIRQTLAVRSEAPFSINQAEEAVEILLQSLETSDALLMAFFRSTDVDTNQARKAVNVTILSLKMGLELGYAREQLEELGLAGLLCDIGTTLMPAQLLASPDPLTASERASLRTHQLEGAKLLEKLAPKYRWLGEVISRRYERADGPYQTENRSEEYAAIIHLADMYRSLVHPRPPRRRIGPLDALKEILQRHRALFPDRTLKALIRAMSTFPVGSLVRLNTGEIGRVVERNKDFPLRPVVEILVRRGKRLGEPSRLDLAQSPLLYIKESVVDEELS